MDPDKKTNSIKLEWEALEHVYYKKTDDWYWIVGTVGVTTSILAFIFDNAILGLLLLIATATMLLHGARVPGVVKVELQERGVRVGTTFYPFAEMKAFSINEESEPAMLVLDTKAWLIPDVRIFIERVSTHDIRNFLLNHLDEKYHEPSISEGLIHYLGF
ncbi:MAG: hypothetical protein AAB590_00360 [Patescibacteria group bacterium]